MNLTPLIESIYLTRRMVSQHNGVKYEKLYKPTLLLAILDIIGEQQNTKIWWNNTLRLRFIHYLSLINSPNHKENLTDPFWRLDCMGWKIFNKAGSTHIPKPKIREFDQLYGQFSHEANAVLLKREVRETLKRAIITRFFPNKEKLLQQPSSIILKEEEQKYIIRNLNESRSTAFSKMVKDIYNEQCVACGQRINIPNLDTSFVDAAHLIPFSETKDDRPSNGITLCKNHHWAMDRHIISPTPDMLWDVSPLIIAQRSPGEAALLALKNTKLLPPKKQSDCTPSPDALKWRHDRLRR